MKTKTLGIIGAGKLGTVLAQLATNAGYEVYIAGSGKPEKIALSMKVLAPRALAVDLQTAVKKSDVVILALPLGKYKTLLPELFAGKLLIDAMNYWWEVDDDESLANPQTSTSELVQAHLKTARVVKAISHIGYHHLHDEALPAGSPKRKAVAIAGDNAEDRKVVAVIVDRLGFDAVELPSLHAGKQLEPGHPAFGAHESAEKLRTLIS